MDKFTGSNTSYTVLFLKDHKRPSETAVAVLGGRLWLIQLIPASGYARNVLRAGIDRL